jgi:hypothetical protein
VRFATFVFGGRLNPLLRQPIYFQNGEIASEIVRPPLA